MDEYEEIRNAAPEIFIKNSFLFLNSLSAKKQFSIVSPFPTIHGVACEIQKSERCFKISAGEINLTGYPVRYQSIGYGYHDPFELLNSEERFTIKNGAGYTNLKLGQGLKMDGELWEMESNYTDDNTYIRAMLPLGEFHKLPLEFIQSSSFREGDSFRGAGLIKMNVQGHSISLYDYNKDKVRYLVIDSGSALTPSQFEKIVEAIIYCFGLISGYVARNEIYFLQSETKEFTVIKGFQFRKIEDSLKGFSAINPRELRDFDKTLKQIPYLAIDIFTNLVSLSLTDVRHLRLIKLITESFDYPIEIQAATFSVALETIKNMIVEKNEDKVNPFKDRKAAAKAIKEMKATIEGIDLGSFNSKETVLKKIDQINQVGNTDSFLLLFRLLEIQLNEDDERCIGKRNDFLHGRIPFENEQRDLKDSELKHIVYKLHFLLCAAILKNSGYSGYLKNNLKFASLLQFKKEINEDFFRKI